MSIFDNMLELNNSFLLIALIIIAVICIYLLYSNLTKSCETASLKSGLTALIQQNKKRDEIINFLLERIENLEHTTVVPSAAPALPQTNVLASTDVAPKHDDIDDILSAANVEQSQVATSTEVIDILESIDGEPSHESENITETQTELHIHEDELPQQQTDPVIHVEDEQHEQTVPVIHVEDELPQQQPAQVSPVTEMHSEFQELESEFEGLMTDQNEPTSVSNDLVSALLDADEESLAGDHEFDLTTVPKSKDKLNAQYTVKQLKALSRQLKLKSKGNKTELINRICEKLN